MTKHFFVTALIGGVLFSSAGRAMDVTNPSFEKLTLISEELTLWRGLPQMPDIGDSPNISRSSSYSPLNPRANVSSSGLSSPTVMRVIDQENRGRKMMNEGKGQGQETSSEEIKERILYERHHNRCRHQSPLEDS